MFLRVMTHSPTSTRKIHMKIQGISTWKYISIPTPTPFLFEKTTPGSIWQKLPSCHSLKQVRYRSSKPTVIFIAVRVRVFRPVAGGKRPVPNWVFGPLILGFEDFLQKKTMHQVIHSDLLIPQLEVTNNLWKGHLNIPKRSLGRTW